MKREESLPGASACGKDRWIVARERASNGEIEPAPRRMR
jgi:hypothetical protein